jgi:hypothetical protein
MNKFSRGLMAGRRVIAYADKELIEPSMASGQDFPGLPVG